MNISNIIDSYINWIKDNTSISQKYIENFYKITTPFLYNDNDHIVFFINQEEQKFILSDDGYFISKLEMSGLTITSNSKKEAILKTTLNGFGAKIRNQKEIYIDASIDDIGQKIHKLIQALIVADSQFIR